jgi:hypothetical protein
VHTVFFGENDYSRDESPSTAGSQELATFDTDRKNRASNGGASSNTMTAPLNILEEKVTEKPSLEMEKKNLQTSDSEDEDGVVTELSDDGEGAETHKSVVVLDKARSSDAEGEKPERAGTCDGIKSGRERIEVSSKIGQSLGGFNQETLGCPVQSKQVDRNPRQDLETDGEFTRISTLESTKISIETELINDNDAGCDDDDFQTCKDLCSGRLNKLASNRKVRFECVIP